MEAAPHPWPALGVLLMRDGLVSKEELEDILAEQRDTRQQRISGRRLGEILVQRGRVTPNEIAKLVAEQYELPFLDFDVADVDVDVAAVLSEDDARRLSALPVNTQPDGTYLLAIADPATVLFSEELRTLLGSLPRFAVVGPDVIERAIDHVFSRKHDSHPPLTAGEEPDGLVLEFPSGGPVIVPAEEGPVARARPLLGELLVRDGCLTAADLDVALAAQRLTPSYRLGEIVVERGLASRGVVARLVAEQYELPFVDVETLDLVPAVVALLDEEVAHRLHAVPIDARDDGSLQVAIADPTSAVYSDELHRTLARPLTLVVASPDAIDAVLARVHGSIDRSAETATALDKGLQFIDDARELERQAEADALVHEVEWAESTDHVAPVAPDELADASGPDGEPLEADLSPWFEPTPEDAVPSFELVLEDPPVVEPFRHEDFLEPVATEQQLPEEPAQALPELPELLGWDVVPIVEDAGEDAVALVPPEDSAPEEDVVDPVPLAEGAETHPVDLEPAIASSDWDVVDVAPLADSVEEHTPDLEPAVESSEWEATDVERAIEDAVAAGAATLHFSPREDGLLVRARADGLVRTLGTATVDERDAAVARLTDGAARVHVARTPLGEKTTVQLAHPDAPSFEDLAVGSLAAVSASLERTHGAVLVTGPARSGVTTTLYAAFARAATSDRVAVGVEDPIERVLPDVDQFEVDRGRGETFASALRTVRFSDPDVVLVGDLPDRETAEVALRIADGGSLVLAGLRSTGALDALRRLGELGVARHLLADSVSCVVSQHLVRTICPECRETYYASDDELLSLREGVGSGPRLLARGRGCAACDGAGFLGRTAIFEVLPITTELRDLLADGASAKKLRRAAEATGLKTLRDDAARLCLDGRTTVAEIERVLGSGI